MKIKEHYSPDFKGERKESGIYGSKLLKKSGDISVYETVYVDRGLYYSTYLIQNTKYNYTFIELIIPNPRKSSEAKDFYLKYQHGARKFMESFFDFFIGEKETIVSPYKNHTEDMRCVLSENDRTALLKLKNSEELVGIIEYCSEKDDTFEISSKEVNLKLAENIIRYFSGEPLKYSWEEICEQ